MAAPKITGFTVAYTAIGGIILWSGIKGETLSNTFKGLLQGQPPNTNEQKIGSPTVGISNNNSNSSNSSNSNAAGNTSASDLTGMTGGATVSGTPSSSGIQALQKAAAHYGWNTGAEWQALNAVEMREAGYSLTAKNPNSNAYGMAQFINGPSEYYTYGGNPNTYDGQAVAMVNYIKQRYGDPIAAWHMEQTAGYY